MYCPGQEEQPVVSYSVYHRKFCIFLIDLVSIPFLFFFRVFLTRNKFVHSCRVCYNVLVQGLKRFSFIF